MWVYGCGGDKPIPIGNNPPTPNIVLYDYQDGRGGVHPNNFLNSYTGVLQIDGYAGYHKTQATLAGCWDNAVVERFFGSLKHDWTLKAQHATYECMAADVAA